MSKKDRLERVKLYTDRNTQMFLNKLLSGETSELEPIYDSELGYRYPIVEAIVGDASSAEVFLNKLCETGILQRRLYDRIIHCPKCDSASISVHYCCPYCKSFNIQKSSLIEHVKCGYMDIEENFHNGNKLICPKCHKELKKANMDYIQAGIWCTCSDCKKSFDVPVTTHVCRDCHANSTFEDAGIKDVYAYSLREEIKEEFTARWAVVAPVREFLQENGFQVESPAFMEGKSGANHMFDIVAYKKGEKRKVTVIDLASSTENAVREQPVIALFAKIFDVSPDSTYFIAIPKMSDNGKKMAQLYNIRVIEAKNQKEVIKALAATMLKK